MFINPSRSKVPMNRLLGRMESWDRSYSASRRSLNGAMDATAKVLSRTRGVEGNPGFVAGSSVVGDNAVAV